MSTNGLVGVVNRDGTVDYVYNHFDSYVKNGLGDFLRKKIKTIQQARKLIEGGDAESLEAKSYYNDKDPNSKVKTNSLDYFLGEATYQGYYCYFFKRGEWFVAYGGLMIPLKYAKGY